MTHIPAAHPDNLEPAVDWRAAGACLTEDSDLFFPLGSTGPWLAIIEQAKTVCRRCPSMEPCLQWALETGQDAGIWGGLAEDERRRLKRRAARTISVDSYAGTPRTRTPVTGRTYEQIWDDCTETAGEHLLWTGPRTVHHPARAITPNRLAFYLDRGRWPEGDVKRVKGTCQASGCVRPAHLADRAERDEEADLKVSA
jgi:hypothetical protein